MADKAKVQTQIDFLSMLERGEVVSQFLLSKRLSVSVGLINALLKRAAQKGFVKIKDAPHKRYAYYLTPKGFLEKGRLVAEYLEVSLEFFRDAKREYAALFTGAQPRGARRFVLVGRGELAEIALLAAREAEVEVVGLFDREVNAARLHGLAVMRSLDDIGEDEVLVLTACQRPQETFDEVRARLPGRELLVPPLLRVALSVERSGAGPAGEAR